MYILYANVPQNNDSFFSCLYSLLVVVSRYLFKRSFLNGREVIKKKLLINYEIITKQIFIITVY